MAKQIDFERITRLVITPIHTIWGWKVSDAVAEAFIEDLSRYSDATLKGAMVELRRTSSNSPKIADIVKACREATPPQIRNDSDALKTVRAEHNRRYDHAQRLASEFLVEFERSPQFRSAKEQGWESRLRAYAVASASLQSQVIAGVRNPGYSMMSFVHPEKQNETEARCREFIATCKRQAASGMIDVTVPEYLIEEWKPKAHMAA